MTTHPSKQNSSGVMKITWQTTTPPKCQRSSTAMAIQSIDRWTRIGIRRCLHFEVVNWPVIVSSPVWGACVKVRTLATKRLNARRREIDRRAFFVSTQSFTAFLRFSRFAGHPPALSVFGEISLRQTQRRRFLSILRKTGPKLSDSLFWGRFRVNAEIAFEACLKEVRTPRCLCIERPLDAMKISAVGLFSFAH